MPQTARRLFYIKRIILRRAILDSLLETTQIPSNKRQYNSDTLCFPVFKILIPILLLYIQRKPLKLKSTDSKAG